MPRSHFRTTQRPGTRHGNDFEDYGRPSYLRGEWQDHGWWYYYLYAALIKIPLGTWELGVLTLILLGFGVYTPRWREIFFLATPPLVIFVVCSSKTGFSEHFRYVLPCFPFAFIWLSGSVVGIKTLGLNKNNLVLHGIEDRMRSKSTQLLLQFAPCLVGFAVMWIVTSSCWIYPHSLSYFNESIGGPLNGPQHLLGSNVDWGQDLRYAESAQDVFAHTHVAYHGYFDPIATKSAYHARVLELGERAGTRVVFFVSINVLAGRSALIYSSFDPLPFVVLQEAERASGPITYCGYSIVGIEYPKGLVE